MLLTNSSLLGAPRAAPGQTALTSTVRDAKLTCSLPVVWPAVAGVLNSNVFGLNLWAPGERTLTLSGPTLTLIILSCGL